MKKLLVGSLVALLALSATQVLAGQNPEIQMALDCQLRNAKRACTPAYTSCSGITQVYAGTGYVDIIVVAYRYDRLKGLEYGVQWTGAPFFTAFVNCADFIIGGTNLGGWMSAAQTWSACQYATDPAPGTSGIGAGWLQLYTYGPMRYDFVPSEAGNLTALDCLGQLDILHTLHSGFTGGEQPQAGDLAPCEMGPTATQAETWGGVKSLYR